jgi:hypothetical protein
MSGKSNRLNTGTTFLSGKILDSDLKSLIDFAHQKDFGPGNDTNLSTFLVRESVTAAATDQDRSTTFLLAAMIISRLNSQHNYSERTDIDEVLPQYLYEDDADDLFGVSASDTQEPDYEDLI